ncbi:MAG: methylenetetrahydrofolate--tRNA-(uracil(54)-C(5))-methyltransferase (FADH(2)-oxidizing) TrmFO, partial [Clostridiaceae bacterium]|nr:methylenetetrahydrofolate--tRNA-(uracil(54)-C(5))-methyltransferase (FADH(2)-oxidizing) TrmFO [Clostridiaceae bacterium]
TGVEGYIESTSSGLVAGINAARQLNKQGDMIFPGNTAIGALAKYISNPASDKFQPMNINFGIIDPLKEKIKNKKERYGKVSNIALEEIENIKSLERKL